MAGKRVEIGAEYLGKDPQWVVVVVAGSESITDDAAKLPRVAGLYLPECAEAPLMPIKTMILPPCNLSPGDRVFLRSRTHVHTICLKEPFEERADFTWSPFEILDC